ncbi:hypothetical protein VZT92_024687 [Zoarces viviparus]
MKGLDDQHAGELVALPQCNYQDLCLQSQQETLPSGQSAFGDVRSAAAEDQSLVEKLDLINKAKLFLQLRDKYGLSKPLYR